MAQAMNGELREHVTRVGFDLTLSKTQIASLVMLDLCIIGKTGSRVHSNVDKENLTPIARMTDRNFISGVKGCINRGLVIHHFNKLWADKALRDPAAFRLDKHYSITRAGRLMVGLLKECGLYEEYATPIYDQLIRVA